MTVAELLPAVQRQHGMGWKRPLPGRSALELLPHADVYGLSVKDEVDPRAKMPPALNQLALGSCTANATNRSFRYDTIMDGKDCGELSRLWTYYFERAIEHTLGQGDTGAEGHDAYTVAKHGIPAETLWPYDISKFEVKPPDAEPRAYKLTKSVHALGYDETAIKAALSNGQTMTYGFTVYRNFEETWDRKGVMPMPKSPREEILGGHENLICGYLKEYPGYFLSLNSWDVTWGIDGYFLIPIKFVLKQAFASDFRTIVRSLGK
jgi:C1A family cysteine protease